MFETETLLKILNIENANQAIVLVLNLGLLALVVIFLLMSIMRFRESKVYLRNQRELTRGLDTGKKLNALQKQKDEFSSISTHELNTPLALIRGNLSMLVEFLSARNDTKKELEIAQKSLDGADRLYAVVSALLNSSKTKIESDDEKTNVWQILEQVVLEFKSKTKGKIVLHPAKKIPLSLAKISPQDLREIVLRIVDNAVKFGEDKQIDIEIEETEATLNIIVKDQGHGIPADKKNMIFEKFYQGDSQWTRKAQGVGLGLFIAKKLADSNNAEISVKSAPGKGAEFTVMVPKAST